MKNLAIILVLATFTSCAMKQRVLNASAVSMSDYSMKKGYVLQEMGEVSGEFCAEPGFGSSSTGLMDEAIKNAQTKKKGSQFIMNATFYKKANCMIVEGEAAKAVRKKTKS
jgi:hypothetical protein